MNATSLQPIAAPAMTFEFIARNQIVERYLAGKLPPRGALEFEQFCRDNPQLLDSLKLSDQVHSALRLLEANGTSLPWTEKPLRFYQKPLAFAVTAAAAGTLLIATLLLSIGSSENRTRISVLERELAEQPLKPAVSTRPIILMPSRSGPSLRSAVIIGGTEAELADFKIDVSWSKFTNFRVTITRVGQGKVAILGNLLRDSNGQLRIGLNSSALGPGDYQFSIDGLDWRGDATPQAWITVGVSR